jgi:hypothetical protein
MRLALALLVALTLLAGCASSAGRGSRALPWNWFAPDHATQLETAQARTRDAEGTQIKAAQENVRATGQALAAEPSPTLPVQVAKEFNNRADAALAQAAGPLTAATDRDLALMVGRLTSENESLRAAGAVELARRDRAEAAISRELEALRAREQATTAKLIESDRRYQEQAEKHRRVWFWIYLIVGGWVLLQVLSGLARFYPGLAPVARAAGMVAAPAVQAAYNRTTTAIGRALADAEAVSKDTADGIRKYLDAQTDAAEQVAIRESYLTSPRS